MSGAGCRFLIRAASTACTQAWLRGPVRRPLDPGAASDGSAASHLAPTRPPALRPSRSMTVQHHPRSELPVRCTAPPSCPGRRCPAPTRPGPPISRTIILPGRPDPPYLPTEAPIPAPSLPIPTPVIRSRRHLSPNPHRSHPTTTTPVAYRRIRSAPPCRRPPAPPAETLPPSPSAPAGKSPGKFGRPYLLFYLCVSMQLPNNFIACSTNFLRAISASVTKKS